jgi:hypothetical protein
MAEGFKALVKRAKTLGQGAQMGAGRGLVSGARRAKWMDEYELSTMSSGCLRRT